jgi:outer membrane protein assembly factor BamB
MPSNAHDYENPWTAPIIMNGKIYYNAPAVSDTATYGYYCRDLYTGEIIWYKNGTDNGLNNPFTTSGGYNLAQSYVGLTQGQLYHYWSVNGQGILAYLIMVSGSTWYFLDSNGNFMLKLINVPGGTAVTDQDGSLLKYSYNPTTGNLLCWNSSQSIPPLSPMGTSQQQWKMRFGATIDAVNDTSWTKVGPSGSVTADMIQPRSGYTMNVTVAKNLPISVSFGAEGGGPTAVLQDENRVPKMLFGFYKGAGSTISSAPDPDTMSAWAISIDDHVAPYSPLPDQSATQNTNLGFGATMLWNKNFTVPLPGKNYTWNLGGVSYADKVFMLVCKQTSQLWGYSLTTGELLWGPLAPFSQEDFWSRSSNMYYGKVLACGSYSGILAAYDAKTGKLLWTYNATAPGHESAYGENMPLSISAVADGKVYLTSSEHSPTKPLWRASYVRCVNITDGKELWKLLDFNSGLAIADGYIVTGSNYDNNIYCIGKGPSAVTVTASPKVSVNGDSVLVEGTVTDQSPGAKGTPAIADADMQAWMEYLYEQQAMPTNAKGVEVTLDALDPNGNFVPIGTVTSDITGTFGYAFKPEVPGTYQIIATFAGSKSYGNSYAQTYLTVDPAVEQPTPTEQIVQLPPFDLYIIGATVAIIIAVAIVGLMILRKKP